MVTKKNTKDLSVARGLISRLKPNWSGEDISGFMYLPTGYSNDNYRFTYNDRFYVLRSPKKKEEKKLWEREYLFYIDSTLVNKPDLVAMDTDTGVMITRWISGDLLGDIGANEDSLIDYVSQLHFQLGSVSHFTCDNYDPVEISKRFLEPYGSAINPDSKRIMNDLAWNPENLVLAHNDLNPWNIIISATSADRWTTLDWGAVAMNDPLFDLIALTQGLSKNDKELDLEKTKRLSDKLLGVDLEWSRIILVLSAFWLREYAWAYSMWRSGNQRQEIKDQIDISSVKLKHI